MSLLILIYRILLIICGIVVNMYAMEENESFVSIFSFYTDSSVLPNAIDEIILLSNQTDGIPAYRDDTTGVSLDRVDSSKGKNSKKDDKDLTKATVNTSLGVIPFKLGIHCGFGYTALSTVLLDSYFFYHATLQLEKNEPKKLCQVNNLMNVLYIIDMLHKVSGTTITTCVDSAYKNYKNMILKPKNINNVHAYEINIKNGIKLKNFEITKLFDNGINQLITYENKDYLYEYRPLKDHIRESLLHLLLYIYVFLQDGQEVNAIELMGKYKNDLIVHAAEQKLAMHVTDNIHISFNNVLEEIRSTISSSNNHFLNKEKDINKRLLAHKFLFILNKYVYELITVPVSVDKTHRLFNTAEKDTKRVKTVDSNSFFERHKQFFTVTKYISLTILISGLLYRLIKNDTKRAVSLF